jgi:hypothetical protein
MASNPDAARPEGSSTAKRMHLYRLRKRYGLRYLNIELPEAKVAALVRMGLLSSQARNDPDAVTQALYVHLARTLVLRSVMRNARGLMQGKAETGNDLTALCKAFNNHSGFVGRM